MKMDSKKNKRAIRRLDFGQCNLKTTKNELKKSTEPDDDDEEEKVTETSSPVLYKKRRASKKLSSPVLLSTRNKRKPQSKSPVLIVKRLRRNLNKTPDDKGKIDISTDEENTCSQYDIEDLSPDTDMFKSSQGISSFSSENVVHSDVEQDTVDEAADMKVRRLKKGSLIERLVQLRKRRASERRIHQHRKRILKSDTGQGLDLCVSHVWTEETCLVLKCVKVDDCSAVSNAFVYALIDRDVDNASAIREGVFFRVLAPWHELKISNFSTTILSINNIEKIDDIPGVSLPKTRLQKIRDTSQYEQSISSIFDALHSESNIGR